MPVYEYECRDCGKRFERLVSFREAKEAQECPECGSRSTRKLMSVVASVRKDDDGVSSCPTCTSGVCNL